MELQTEGRLEKAGAIGPEILAEGSQLLKRTFNHPSPYHMQPMRLWSLHPQYLDQKGLVALWREALLAQAVLRRIAKGERNVGYANHPQLSRFLAQRAPMATLARYLRAVHEESLNRGYRFDASSIDGAGDSRRIEVTAGQLRFERRHLLAKLERRDPDRCVRLIADPLPAPNPLFETVPGEVADWERP